MPLSSPAMQEYISHVIHTTFLNSWLAKYYYHSIEHAYVFIALSAIGLLSSVYWLVKAARLAAGLLRKA